MTWSLVLAIIVAVNEMSSPLTYIVISAVTSLVTAIIAQTIGQLMRSNMYAKVQEAHEHKLSEHDGDIRALRDTLIELAVVCRMKFEMNPDPSAADTIQESLKRLNAHISRKGG